MVLNRSHLVGISDKMIQERARDEVAIMQGIVLVWDLDETLTFNSIFSDCRINEMSCSTIFKNEFADVWIKKVSNWFDKNSLHSNVVITNNGYNGRDAKMDYIKNALQEFKEGSNYLFDYVMDADGYGRKLSNMASYTKFNRFTFNSQPSTRDTQPSKSVYDVKNILSDLQKTSENIENRIFYFDDQPRTHLLCEQIPASNCIEFEYKFGNAPSSVKRRDPVYDHCSVSPGKKALRPWSTTLIDKTKTALIRRLNKLMEIDSKLDVFQELMQALGIRKGGRRKVSLKKRKTAKKKLNIKQNGL